MNRKSWAIALTAVLIVLNLAVIWGNSLQPGDVSRVLSGNVHSTLRRLLPFLSEEGERLLRKIAHFSEFGCLGFLLSLLFWQLEKRTAVAPLFCGLLAACMDETIQSFVAGRSSELRDVWIDFAGTAAGVLVLYIVLQVFLKRRKL